MMVIAPLLFLLGMIAYRLVIKPVNELQVHPKAMHKHRTIDVKKVRLFMMIAITFIALGSAIYVLVSDKFESQNKDMAFGIIGAFIGFWFKP